MEISMEESIWEGFAALLVRQRAPKTPFLSSRLPDLKNE
jgi:hypothetical protein